MSSFVNWKNCRRFALWLTFWAMATAAGGCVERVTAPIVSTSVGRDLESFAEFKDVPYPANMVFNKDESFTYRRRGLMSGLVVVSGRMNSDELGAYYDQHLPAHGWSPLAEIHYSAALTSTWQKGDRILTVMGRPLSYSVTPEIRVELWLAPPHTKEELGRRPIYQKSTVKEESSFGRGLWDDMFKRNSGKDGVNAEDI